MFGFNPAPSEETSRNARMAMEQNMELMSTMLAGVQTVCVPKCMTQKHVDDSLNKGESVCADRCVNKYIDSWQMMLKMAEKNMRQQQQQ